MRKMIQLISMTIMFIAISGVSFADDVTDSITEAMQYYQSGKMSEAMQSLNYASQLIAQKKASGLESLLPKPLEGWTAEDATSQGIGTQMFGGGITAERRYNKDSSSISVQIVTDSPMLQSMVMMIGNPMIAGADGGKIEKISGEKAIVKYNATEKYGTINLVVANRYLITVEGSEVMLDDLKGYASAVDYKQLSTLQ